MYKKRNPSSSSPGSDGGFDEAVSKARQKIAGATNNVHATASQPNFQTLEGDFDVKYMDRGNVQNGFTKIKLTNCASQYKIEGTCSDADGSATITEGFATYAGDAFWVEETFEGTDKGLKVLTEGQFNFANNAFSGTWRSNTGIRGNYTEFKGKNVSKTFSPGMASEASPQTLEQMLEEDIPLAVATVETPVATDAPVVVQAVPEVEPTAPTVSAIPAPSAPPPEQATTNNTGPELYVPRN